MANRREFLQSAAALSAAPLASQAFSETTSRAPALDAVIYDARYHNARDFAAFAADLGAPRHAIQGDVTDLWLRELRGRWQGAPRPLAGLTERSALFLLEHLAWEHGLRVVFQAEHESGMGGAPRHRMLRCADPRLGAELETAGEGWPGVLADALVLGRGPASDGRPSEAAMADHPDETDNKLYSWVIAPPPAAHG